LVFILYSVEALAADKYIDPDCAINGDGTLTTCTEGAAGTAGAYNAFPSIASNTSYYIKAGSTLVRAGILSISSKTNVLIGKYGTGGKYAKITMNADADMIWASNSTNTTIQDLELVHTGNSPAYTNNTVTIGRTSDGSIVERVWIHGGNQLAGVRFFGVDTLCADNMILRDSIIEDSWDGFCITGATNVLAERNIIRNTRDDSVETRASGDDVCQINGAIVRSNTLMQPGMEAAVKSCIDVQGSGTLLIDSNYCNANGENGFSLERATTTVRNNIVVNSYQNEVDGATWATTAYFYNNDYINSTVSGLVIKNLRMVIKNALHRMWRT